MQMKNTEHSKFIQIPVATVNVEDFIQQLSDENFQLRQVIDEMANAIAKQKELIQQLTALECEVLKYQNLPFRGA
jgi:hypothetical protein